VGGGAFIALLYPSAAKSVAVGRQYVCSQDVFIVISLLMFRFVSISTKKKTHLILSSLEMSNSRMSDLWSWNFKSWVGIQQESGASDVDGEWPWCKYRLGLPSLGRQIALHLS